MAKSLIKKSKLPKVLRNGAKRLMVKSHDSSEDDSSDSSSECEEQRSSRNGFSVIWNISEVIDTGMDSQLSTYSQFREEISDFCPGSRDPFVSIQSPPIKPLRKKKIARGQNWFESILNGWWVSNAFQICSLPRILLGVWSTSSESYNWPRKSWIGSKGS